MKKIISIVMALAMITLMTACGRNRGSETSTDAPSTTRASTGTSIIPDEMPTLDTNIPDPSVDTSMPEFTSSTQNTQDAANNTK